MTNIRQGLFIEQTVDAIINFGTIYEFLGFVFTNLIFAFFDYFPFHQNETFSKKPSVYPLLLNSLGNGNMCLLHTTINTNGNLFFRNMLQ
jgi:hypothetical protein